MPNASEGEPAAFDVFISYSSADRTVVGRLVRRLKHKGVEPWFDQWNLSPGGAWQDEITTGLLRSSACAVFVGPGDLGRWERLETAIALNRAAEDPSYRLFAVVLPGPEPFEPADLPPLLATRTWVDLREGPESDHVLQRLVNAVYGVPFGHDMPIELENDSAPYQGLAVFDEEDARFFFGLWGSRTRLPSLTSGSRLRARTH